MAEEIFKVINCPERKGECTGLAVALFGEGIELEQKDNGYIVKTREGHEAFGNCSHYQQCYQKAILQSRRKSSQIKLHVLGNN